MIFLADYSALFSSAAGASSAGGVDGLSPSAEVSGADSTFSTAGVSSTTGVSTTGSRVGVMVEVNCETDFVARSDKFRELAHEIALQIAASAPRYLKVEEIPAEVLEHEAEIARARAKEEGKPDNILEKIVQGRLEKFKDEAVLQRQSYIRDESLTVEKLILQTVAAIGENVIVRRFQRWELGESLNN